MKFHLKRKLDIMKYIKLYEDFNQSDEKELENILTELSNQEIRIDIEKSSYYDGGITSIFYKFDDIKAECSFSRIRSNDYHISSYIINKNNTSYGRSENELKLQYLIFEQIDLLYNNYNKMRLCIVGDLMNKFGLDEEKFLDLDERIEEFDVIKDYKLDTISLNNLYDFLGMPFDESKFTQVNESNEVNIKNANKPEEERISEEERRFNLEVKLTNLYNELSNQQIRNDIFHSQDYSDGKQTIRYQIPTIELVAEYMSAYRRYFVSLNHEYCDKFGQNIYVQLQRLFHYNNEFTNKIIRDLSVKISIDLGGYQTHQELLSIIKERIEEFEVLKNYQVDYISLNSLYDYYGCRFDENEFIFTLNSILKSKS